MPLSDTPRSHGALTRTLHWASALLLAGVAVLGLRAHWLAGDLARAEGAEAAALVRTTAEAFSLHKTLGLCLLALTLVRIEWLRGQQRARLIRGDRPVTAFLALWVRALLYGTLILVPLTGWLHHAASEGFAPILWPLGQSLPFVPSDPWLAGLAATLHRALLVTLALALLLHVAGALRHHYMLRDATLVRMIRGTPTEGSERQPRRLWPVLATLPVWAGVLAASLALPAAAPPQGQRPTITGAGDWRVTEGRIRLTVTQFGSDITGEFANWSADVAWAERGNTGTAGHAVVTIDLASLTLGALTRQALGPDFLDVANHPQAVFAADLIRRIDGPLAEGALKLRGVERPVSFPFRLTIDSGTAYAGAVIALDRRDFGIGANLDTDEALAFPVTVRFDLQAERAR